MKDNLNFFGGPRTIIHKRFDSAEAGAVPHRAAPCRAVPRCAAPCRAAVVSTVLQAHRPDRPILSPLICTYVHIHHLPFERHH